MVPRVSECPPLETLIPVEGSKASKAGKQQSRCRERRSKRKGVRKRCLHASHCLSLSTFMSRQAFSLRGPVPLNTTVKSTQTRELKSPLISSIRSREGAGLGPALALKKLPVSVSSEDPTPVWCQTSTQWGFWDGLSPFKTPKILLKQLLYFWWRKTEDTPEGDSVLK